MSVDGGVEPIWAPNGELFYRHPITHVMMHVRITMNGALTVPTPAQLFDASAYASWGVGASPRAYYDVTADGQRFLMLRPVQGAASAPPQLVLIQNWTEELKQRVPTR